MHSIPKIEKSISRIFETTLLKVYKCICGIHDSINIYIYSLLSRHRYSICETSALLKVLHAFTFCYDSYHGIGFTNDTKLQLFLQNIYIFHCPYDFWFETTPFITFMVMHTLLKIYLIVHCHFAINRYE